MIVAMADPEPFSKVAALVGAAVAIAFFVLIGRRDDVPSGASTDADTGQPPGSAGNRPA